MATRLFASGGSLDSQTSETQWYKNLSGSDGHVQVEEQETPYFGKSHFS